jgi:hypothetical protein
MASGEGGKRREEWEEEGRGAYNMNICSANMQCVCERKLKKRAGMFVCDVCSYVMGVRMCFVLPYVFVRWSRTGVTQRARECMNACAMSHDDMQDVCVRVDISFPA